MRSSPCRLNFRNGTSHICQRHTKCGTKLHLASWVIGSSGCKDVECQLCINAALFKQRHIHPEGDGCCCKRNTKDFISMRGKCPIKGRAQVIDPPPEVAKPFSRGPILPFCLSSLEQRPIVFGMAACQPLALSALIELLERISSRGIEQPIPRDVRRDVGHN